jgi:hypothetical protein
MSFPFVSWPAWLPPMCRHPGRPLGIVAVATAGLAPLVVLHALVSSAAQPFLLLAPLPFTFPCLKLASLLFA